MYKPSYLEAARQDIVEIANYITNELKNPIAASQLVKEIINTVNKICAFPYMYPLYFPLDNLKKEYRKVSVKNYLLFYFVDEENKLVSVARVIYARRDYNKLLAHEWD